MQSSPISTRLSRSTSPTGYDQVVQFLTDQLQAGILKAGDRLLPERELALRLNISRPIVREALRALAMIGVLEMQQGRGTFVRSPDFSTLGNIFHFMFSLAGEDIDDVLELRQGIEKQAVRLACLRARGHDFEKIGAALQIIKMTINDAAIGGQADFAFHTHLVEASHSAALIKVYKVISQILQTNHIERRARITLTERMREYIVDHHDLLFRALQRRDMEASERLLSEHFAIGEKLNNESMGRTTAAIG